MPEHIQFKIKHLPQILVIAALCLACNKPDENEATLPPSDMTLSSSSFQDGGSIPLTHVCTNKGGQNLSPPLTWSGAPTGTAAFALIMDDEDSPCGQKEDACKHWSVYNLPAERIELAQAQKISEIQGATEGNNYKGEVGYAGPCPPNTHSYHITVYATDGGMPQISSGTGLTRSEFESQYKQHILGGATLAGVFAP